VPLQRHTRRQKIKIKIICLFGELVLNCVLIRTTFKMKKGLIYILGGAAALFLLTRKSLSKKLVFQLKDVGTSGKWFAPVLVIKFRILNPSNQSAVVNSVAGELFMNNDLVTNISTFTKQKIGAKSESTLTLEAKPGLTDVFSTLIKVISNKKKNYTFKFVGNANIDGLIVPIAETYKI